MGFLPWTAARAIGSGKTGSAAARWDGTHPVESTGTDSAIPPSGTRNKPGQHRQGLRAGSERGAAAGRSENSERAVARRPEQRIRYGERTDRPARLGRWSAPSLATGAAFGRDPIARSGLGNLGRYVPAPGTRRPQTRPR